jgi:hypothetical protein
MSDWVLFGGDYVNVGFAEIVRTSKTAAGKWRVDLLLDRLDDPLWEVYDTEEEAQQRAFDLIGRDHR